MHFLLTIVIYLFLFAVFSIPISSIDGCRDVSTNPKHSPFTCKYYHIVFVILLNPNERMEDYAQIVKEILTPCTIAEKNGTNKSKVSFINGPNDTFTTFVGDNYPFEDNNFQLYIEYTEDFDSTYNLFNLVSNFTQSIQTEDPTDYYTVVYVITNLLCRDIKKKYSTLYNDIENENWQNLIESGGISSRIIWTKNQTEDELSICEMEALQEYSSGFFAYETNSLSALLNDKQLPYRYGLCNFSGPMPTFGTAAYSTTEISIDQFCLSSSSPSTPFFPSSTVPPTSQPWGHYVIYVSGLSAISLFVFIIVFFVLRRLFCNTWTPWRPIIRWIRVHILRDKPNTDEFGRSRNSGQSYNYPSFTGNGMKEKKDDWEIEALKLMITNEKLGEGAYAIVYKGILKGTPPVMKVYPTMQLSFSLSDIENEVAVKMPPTTARYEEKKTFLQEIEFMKQLEYYPHLLSLLACSTDVQYPLLVTEYCEKGDLLHLVREIAEKAKEEDSLLLTDLLPISWQVSDALCFLSSRKIIHRDVAARNVLITKTKVAKLSDFGLCRYNNEMFYTTRGGKLPIKWMSPESIEYAKFNEKTDVWSFGVFLFEVFSLGQTPYQSIQPEDMLEYLKKGNRLKTPEDIPEDVSLLMTVCCQFLPIDRPDFSFLRQKLYKIMELESNNDGYLQFHNNYYRLTIGIEEDRVENEDNLQ